VSSGSVSNILTKTAQTFEPEFNEIVQAGLASTACQQTDDTSARVQGQFWHTHILYNPFYAAYFTRARKDRLTVLAVLQKLGLQNIAPQNTGALRFQFGAEALALLRAEFNIPDKWQQVISDVGEASTAVASMALGRWTSSRPWCKPQRNLAPAPTPTSATVSASASSCLPLRKPSKPQSKTLTF